jgi:hypothetical protein
MPKAGQAMNTLWNGYLHLMMRKPEAIIAGRHLLEVIDFGLEVQLFLRDQCSKVKSHINESHIIFYTLNL